MVSALKRTGDSLRLEGQRRGAIYVKVMTAIADRNVENERDCHRFGGEARMLRYSLYRDPRFYMAMAIQIRLAGAVTKGSMLNPGDCLQDSTVQLRLSLIGVLHQLDISSQRMILRAYPQLLGGYRVRFRCVAPEFLLLYGYC